MEEMVWKVNLQVLLARLYAKQKYPERKIVRGQSEAALYVQPKTLISADAKQVRIYVIITDLLTIYILE